MHRRLIASAALLLLSASAARAQNLSPTDGGGNWQVSCLALTGAAPACNNAFVDAVRVTATPGGWASVPVAGPAGNAYYIATTASATVWDASPDEAANYQYTFRTTFNVLDVNAVTGINLNVFRLDNYFVGWSLNGSAFSSAGMAPNAANVVGQNYWETPYTLAIPGAGVVNGQNTLELRIQGNGRTDAILAQGSFSTVPEPGSMLLLGIGLSVCGIAVRKRRAR